MVDDAIGPRRYVRLMSDDLDEVLRRRALTEDAARPEAVARRHAAGGRTARENIADLVDPNSFVEYGRFAVAAQRQRRDLDDLIARTPADGLIGGTARINGHPAAVLSYDYTVLAGTQGVFGHLKKDRLFELIEKMRLPTVFFAEGGGGRPGDTDYPTISSLEVRAFKLWAALSGVVPRIAVVKGRCFAGNAVIAGCSDLIVATADTSIGMGGPAMIAGGGLGEVAPDDVGPISMQAPNGVVDVVVADEAAAVAVTKTLIGYFQGTVPSGPTSDQKCLRTMIPEQNRRAYPVMPIIAANRPAAIESAPSPALTVRSSTMVRLAGSAPARSSTRDRLRYARRTVPGSLASSAIARASVKCWVASDKAPACTAARPAARAVAAASESTATPPTPPSVSWATAAASSGAAPTAT